MNVFLSHIYCILKKNKGYIMITLLNIGVTLSQKVRCCGNNSPNRNGLFRFEKLKFLNQSFMCGLLNLKVWDNPPMAPPNH